MHANTYCPIRNANANAIWHAILHLQCKCQRTSILSVSFATIFYHLKDLFFFLNCVFVSLSLSLTILYHFTLSLSLCRAWFLAVSQRRPLNMTQTAFVERAGRE